MSTKFPLSLQEAKASSKGYVVLEGEHGAWIYLVCPAELVMGDEKTLAMLASELEDSIFPNDTRGASVRYEWLNQGEELNDHGSGEESGIALKTIWLPTWLTEAGIGDRIQRVITGGASKLNLSTREKALINTLQDERHKKKFREELEEDRKRSGH